MKTQTDAAADGQTTAAKPEAATPLQLHCRVLINGMVYNDAHHAKDKEMPVDKDKAEFLAGTNPPQLEILGTA